jgi:hypothetical protein
MIVKVFKTDTWDYEALEKKMQKFYDENPSIELININKSVFPDSKQIVYMIHYRDRKNKIENILNN